MVLRVLIFPPNILLNQAETAHIAHSLRPRCLADGVRGFAHFKDTVSRTACICLHVLVPANL